MIEERKSAQKPSKKQNNFKVIVLASKEKRNEKKKELPGDHSDSATCTRRSKQTKGKRTAARVVPGGQAFALLIGRKDREMPRRHGDVGKRGNQ